ncbi:MAG: ACP S-malonyltransferase [Ruminococcus sp.]|nr:ACP S-malonyltransferase [Ruminococcus sp.]
MGKIAFVFSGQGDQFSGMGRELLDSSVAAKKAFELCESLREGTIRQCFEGTAEELKETKNTQPCLFAMELAACEALKAKGISPEGVAGFSLGEVVAATVSGAFSKEDGFKLVCKRGELMGAEADKFDTSMVAVVKLTNEQVEQCAAKFENVYPVNFNCPSQVTCSGLTSEITAFADEVKSAGGRVVPLKVKGAFHSPFMKNAAEAFKAEIEKVEIKEREIPLYSNKTAEVYDKNVAELLSAQICSPVKWEQTICNMISAGFDTFIEMGPGRTLTNMIKKIDMNVKAQTVFEALAEVENA